MTKSMTKILQRVPLEVSIFIQLILLCPYICMCFSFAIYINICIYVHIYIYVCVYIDVCMNNYTCCSSANLSFVWNLNANNMQPYMSVPECTSCHKAIMAVTRRACFNKIIHTYIYTTYIHTCIYILYIYIYIYQIFRIFLQIVDIRRYITISLDIL